ncbi:hypothetical protein WICPIJ_004056 [Wickerhamomyces pijperi]|uniref:Uncharacterized protein n=1 Tax=Wickerhamomyces pijperi TaxID=599730 RepID=A0A9P8Q603_WICPI|nr:hypothetical protein WICPIJ_004056 [Wickerhamomyces pijperi]
MTDVEVELSDTNDFVAVVEESLSCADVSDLEFISSLFPDLINSSFSISGNPMTRAFVGALRFVNKEGP